MSFEEFEALYPQLRDEMGWYGMGHGLDEDFRIYKRDQFNFKDQFVIFKFIRSKFRSIISTSKRPETRIKELYVIMVTVILRFIFKVR